MVEQVKQKNWWFCRLFGHPRNHLRAVYKNPYSQHPITVTDDRDRMKFKCSRCGAVVWIA